MDKVGVLLSTYNGEKYLRQQLDSILKQQGVEIRLFIRDDGSKDATMEILEEYYKANDKVMFIWGENIGVGRSFMDLICDSPQDCDYYALADQDDIWDENKLQVAVEALKRTGKMLYASNQMCIDANGKQLGLRYGKEEKVNIKSEEVFACNMLAGCTMVFDNRLKCLLSEESRRPSDKLFDCRLHDVWVINVAAAYDSVVYDCESHMQYRQHENNVVGAYEKGFLDNIKNRISNVTDNKKRNPRSRLAMELAGCFNDVELPRAIVMSAEPGRFGNKMYLLSHMNQIISSGGESKCGLALKILFNLY